MSYTFDIDKWYEERKIARINKAKSLKSLNKYFKDLGYKYIRVWYEGAGDSGECFHAEGWKSEINIEYKSDYQYKPWNHNEEKDFDEWKNMDRNQKELSIEYSKYIKEHPDEKLSSDLHWFIVDIVDYDWYNNEGGQGEVIWDLEKESITVNGEQNRRSYIECKEEYFLDGSDPKTSYRNEVMQ